MAWEETTLKEDAELCIPVRLVYFTGVGKESHGSGWMQETHVQWTICGLLMIWSFKVLHQSPPPPLPMHHDASFFFFFFFRKEQLGFFYFFILKNFQNFFNTRF
jgi:hypothetical protein